MAPSRREGQAAAPRGPGRSPRIAGRPPRRMRPKSPAAVRPRMTRRNPRAPSRRARGTSGRSGGGGERRKGSSCVPERIAVAVDAPAPAHGPPEEPDRATGRRTRAVRGRHRPSDPHPPGPPAHRDRRPGGLRWGRPSGHVRECTGASATGRRRGKTAMQGASGTPQVDQAAPHHEPSNGERPAVPDPGGRNHRGASSAPFSPAPPPETPPPRGRARWMARAAATTSGSRRIVRTIQST